MIIDEAIKLLTIFNTTCNVPTMPILEDAIKLGIEALKEVKQSRIDPSTYISYPLPGETEK